MDVKRKQAAEAAALSRTGTAILRKGKVLGVKWLPKGEHLGFTSASPFAVNVAWDHELFEGLSDDEKAVMRMGVFAHELLHQKLTNFDYTNELTEKMTQAEAGVFMRFANTLEDPAIEYFAHNIFGGNLLDALHFSIRHIYVKSPGIGEEPFAFEQLINALIQFGDMGIIKGKFTFPEAEEYFRKVAPLYNEGIECQDSKRRIDIAKECMKICRPLWEEMIKDREELEKLIEELLKGLEQKGSGASEKETSRMKGAPDSVHEKRTDMVKKIAASKAAKEEETEGEESDDTESGAASTDEMSEETENTGTAGGEESLDDESDDVSDKTSDNKADASESEETENSDEEATGSGDGEDSEEEPSDKTNGSSSDDSSDNAQPAADSADDDENSSESKDSGANDDTESKPSDTHSELEREEGGLDDLCSSEDEANEIVTETYEIDDAVIERLREELESDVLREANEASVEKTEVRIPDFNITSSVFKSASCLNHEIKVTSAGAANLYNNYVSMYNWDIKNLTKTLTKIFESEHDEAFRATSGSYNIKRGSIGTTARIFDKRREKGNLKDAAVVLCVDQSGSMGGPNIEAAKKASIVFAESLTKLRIPYYIMGFEADDAGYDAVHDHFVTWENKPSQRVSLINMAAKRNNFDGYSIRYAAELLKTRSETNKIMFVISDGQPACYKYSGCRDGGIIDTANAIKDSRKFGTIFGIALGGYCGPELLQGMYGKDFIHCPDTNLLTQTLCKQLERVFKNKKM